MNSSAIFGNLILLGAVALLVIGMFIKREKDYKQAMDKYVRDVEAYVKAVELYGVQPSEAALDMQTASAALVTAAAPTAGVASHAAAGVALPAVPATSSGEVLLSGVDDKTAAMIIAILCDELGKQPAELRFHSITAL